MPPKVYSLYRLIIWIFLGCSFLLSFAATHYYFYAHRSNFSHYTLKHQLKNKDSSLLKLQAEAKHINDMLDSLRASLKDMGKFTKSFQNDYGFALPIDGEGEESAMEAGILDKSTFPFGLNLENLQFRDIYTKALELNWETNKQNVALKNMIQNILQKSDFFESTPSLTPAKGWISSHYGTRRSPFSRRKVNHRGLDIASRRGTPIYAAADGVVIYSGRYSGFGNLVVLAHGYGLVTKYGHNHENLVITGQKVVKGDKIATMGSTGRSTGPHLHYEVWLHGESVDPMDYIPKKSPSRSGSSASTQ